MPFVAVRTSRGEREFDAARADADEAWELEELEPDRAASGLPLDGGSIWRI